jgi:hypothetical protein
MDEDVRPHEQDHRQWRGCDLGRERVGSGLQHVPEDGHPALERQQLALTQLLKAASTAAS